MLKHKQSQQCHKENTKSAIFGKLQTIYSRAAHDIVTVQIDSGGRRQHPKGRCYESNLERILLCPSPKQTMRAKC
jgi:hypothetical protein